MAELQPRSATVTDAARAIPRVPAWAIVGVAAAVAAACGRFFADGRIKYGAALVLGSAFVPLVFFELPAAFAMWTAVLYVKDFRVLSVAPNTMGVLVGLGFIGVLIKRGGLANVLSQHRRVIGLVTLCLLWLTISAAWAEKPGTALQEAGYWWLGALAFLITLSVLRGRDIKWIALAFVVGASLSAAIGLSTGGISSAASAAAAGVTQTVANGRLTGGGGDPNLQAAGFIAAMFLAIGLLSVYRRRWARVGLVGAFVLVTAAFFATQSRGGLLALGVSALVSLLLFPGQRRRMLMFVLVAGVTAVIAVSTTPGSLSRITDFGGGTSGRSDIWAVAGQVFFQHPIVGVGLYNFQVVEPRFDLIHKTLTRVSYIAETPEPAHNTYLQLLADDGIIGLTLYLAFVFACLGSAWLAARTFLEQGRRAYAYLAQATLMGMIGMLTAVFFFSDGDDWRLWILLGLGPALLALARTRAPDFATATRARPSIF